MKACYVPAGEIPMTNNPVYGTTHKTITETTEEIGKYTYPSLHHVIMCTHLILHTDTSRNPVYGIHNSKTNINTGQDSQEYEEVWLH